MKTRDFTGWQLLLAVAALLALTMHNSLQPLWSQFQIGMAQWTQANQLQAMTQWAVPAFAALTGSIFLAPSHEWKMKTLWRRILVPAVLSCIFWWCACAVMYLQQHYPAEMDPQTFFHCLGLVLTSPANISYCQMLVSMFLLYPLLRRIAAEKQVMSYCLLILFVLNLLLPLLRQVPHISVAMLFFDQLNWGFFRAWAFYLLLGAYLSKHALPWQGRLAIYCLGMISTALIIALTSWMTKDGMGYYAEFTGMHSPFTACQVAAVIVLSREMLGHVRISSLSRRLSGLWMSVPVAFVIHTFTSRFLPAFSGHVLPYAIVHMITDAALTLLLIAAFGLLPGFRCLVGDYQAKGE